jgi:hypothetical protein
VPAEQLDLVQSSKALLVILERAHLRQIDPGIRRAERN